MVLISIGSEESYYDYKLSNIKSIRPTSNTSS